jgi:hypothetical protein
MAARMLDVPVFWRRSVKRTDSGWSCSAAAGRRGLPSGWQEGKAERNVERALGYPPVGDAAAGFVPVTGVASVQARGGAKEVCTAPFSADGSGVLTPVGST